MDAGSDTQGFLGRAGEVSQLCDVCRASEKAAHSPVAGSPSESSFKKNLQVDLLSLDDTIALRAKDLYSKHPPLLPVRSEKLLGIKDAFRGSRIPVWVDAGIP